MSIYIIIFSVSTQREILVDRIKMLSTNTFKALDNVWFVGTNKTAEDIYKSLNADDTFGNSSIMAAKISTEDKMYWGCMNRDLWPWINHVKNL